MTESEFQEQLWQPSLERKSASQMTAFAAAATKQVGRDLSSYQDLYRWSVDEPAAFWALCANFVDIRWQRPPSTAYIPPPAGKMLGAKWFPDAQLNFAENLLPAFVDHDVILGICEGRAEVLRLSGKQIQWQVARCAAALKRLGVGRGDRVAAVVANIPEAIIAMLAATSLGAVWASCSPDFGIQGIVDRIGQIEPKVLFFSSAYYYGGKRISCSDTIRGCLANLKSPKVVLINHLDSIPEPSSEFVPWADFLSTSGLEIDLETPPKFAFAAVPFDHPLFIMFSSGTTGVPKCIVHGTGGTLLQHKKELLLHTDLRPSDRLFFFTTCGWMMWNWMVSGLSTGAGLLVYDGSVAHPNLSVLWRIVAEHGVTIFGTSPKFIGTCMLRRLLPRQKFDLRRLRTVLSTGSPLLPDHFRWIYHSVHPDVHLASISGGTDIISCFMLGNPDQPVVAGEIQCRGLGMAVEAWDDAQQPMIGSQGELVCTKPFVSMPVGFLHDPDQEKYRKAYFDHYPDREVWRHGDFVELTERGSIIVYGRSDATLNPGGVRIGTAELYRQIETIVEIADSVAIGHKYNGDTRIVLFVKMADKQPFSDATVQRVKTLIRSQLTPRHVPALVLPVHDIPYTRNGKKVEIAVTQAVHGEPVKNLMALANPEVIQEYVKLGLEMQKT